MASKLVSDDLSLPLSDTTKMATEGSVSPSISKRRKDMFGDCALVEIIHLHDCLRGALRALERDVDVLNHKILLQKTPAAELNELEGRVNGRFKVIWSVFRAHSSAEDEFIWPALQLKTQGLVKGSPHYRPDAPEVVKEEPENDGTRSECGGGGAAAGTGAAHPAVALNSTPALVEDDAVMDQEAYEEDHADEERMFSNMDDLLSQLRTALFQQEQASSLSSSATQEPSSRSNKADIKGEDASDEKKSVDKVMKWIHDLTGKLSRHLMEHLEKEEKQCMPLVVKHLSKSEIHDLVGQIMGKRSSDMISEIMTMAVQNLNEVDRLEMVKYMKQAMAGTFFDKWLSMSGWMENVKSPSIDETKKRSNEHQIDSTNSVKRSKADTTEAVPNASADSSHDKTPFDSQKLEQKSIGVCAPNSRSASQLEYHASDITSQAELEKLIRAIVTNPTLNPQQKNTTIQGLRDSVWKSNNRLKGLSGSATGNDQMTRNFSSNSDTRSAAASVVCVPVRRVTPPSIYYKKNDSGKLEVAWREGNPLRSDEKVPLFSASELAPSHHDGATGAVLGCPHYARACKLRHPVSGRLYTCRLCCEQEREMPSKDKDEPLDRYAVQEVMCMKCNALQPAEDRCINPSCESEGRSFAKYFCKICHLYDDRPRPIFHCPYCNTCRMGLGLGIDFRHCMRCNACVSLTDHEHRCIPQKLQGSCPICHESLFQSTEPLRGLKCGHVMHLSCFTNYRRGQSYNCPLCMKSMEDMTDYFALLDAAVRMQPMPMAYLSTLSNIYCQDCEKSGQCRYHFVGQKCPHCGSYNTRELGRVQTNDTAFPPMR